MVQATACRAVIYGFNSHPQLFDINPHAFDESAEFNTKLQRLHHFALSLPENATRPNRQETHQMYAQKRPNKILVDAYLKKYLSLVAF